MRTINVAIGTGCLPFQGTFNNILSFVILLGMSDLESNPFTERHCCLLF